MLPSLFLYKDFSLPGQDLSTAKLLSASLVVQGTRRNLRGGGVNQKTFRGVGMNNYFLEQHNVFQNLLTI